MRYIRWELLAAIFLSTAASPVDAACRIEVLADLPLQPNPVRALVKGAVNGVPTAFILDTGAWASAMPYPDAQKLGVRLDSTQQFTSEGIGGGAHSTFGHFDLRLGQTDLPHEIITVVNTSSLDNGAAALIGRELIGQQDLELDLPANEVRIEKVVGCAASELAYWNKPYALAQLEAGSAMHPAIVVDVLLNGHVVAAELDSGSPYSVVTPGVARTAHGDLVKGGSSDKIGGLGSNQIGTQVVRFQTFTIGDETIKNPELIVSDLWKYNKSDATGTRLGPMSHEEQPEMLLGADFLRAHHVLVANSLNVMVFSYMGGPVFDISQPARKDAGQGAPNKPAAPAH